MEVNFMFFVNSILLGVGLAMDAFSVSVANGLADRTIKKPKMFLISGTFAIFQILMPLIGWLCVHYLLSAFSQFEKFIPYIALALLLIIGIKMIVDASKQSQQSEPVKLGFISLLVQGIATSIDALSVGFTIGNYTFLLALFSSLIIGIVTFILCFCGILIGKKFGDKFSNKATLIGGIILILIGIEIFITGII